MSIVEAYYNQNAGIEWKRLERHRTEFAVTLRTLDEFLLAPPASILDNGGGPGRYAIALAQKGYDVTLTDLSAGNLALAHSKASEAGVALVQIIQANALDLSAFPDASFDSVLMLGPLYHLLTEQERLQALAEARRVLKRNGLIFAAFITRFAPIRDAAQGRPEWVLDNWEYAHRMLEDGVHDRALGFTSAYFARPDEIAPLLEQAGFEQMCLLGCEGVVAGHEEKVNALDGEAWERWVDLNYRLGKEPSLFGAADHLLFVGRRKTAV